MRNGTQLTYLRCLFEDGATSSLTDGQLLERFAARNGESSDLAFAALVDRHGAMVFRVCQAILRDEHEAMDTFQATFLLLAQKGRSLWVRDSLGPWLHRVACRVAARAKALARRRQRLAERAAKLAASRSPSGDQDAYELASELHDVIDSLPDHYRVAVILCELNGYTVEEAARLAKCPVGTLASRLARGREKLRDRLTRRGAGLALPALVSARSESPTEFAFPPRLADSTVRLVTDFVGRRAAEPVLSTTAVALATDVTRSLLMTKLRISAAAIAALGGVSLVSAWAANSVANPPASGPSAAISARTQGPAAGKQAASDNAKPDPAPKPLDELELLADPMRDKDSLASTVGNLRPLVKGQRGMRFQIRIASTYKDGTAKLWSLESRDPVVPPLRHSDPIREAAFIEQAKLLITTSDHSVKVWDALSGALRKAIDGEVMRPLFFSDFSTCEEPGAAPIRFATVDANGRFVTMWDAITLKSIGVIRREGEVKLIGAALTRDGRTLATIAEDRSITLWAVADKKVFATFRPPSPLVAQCFVDDVRFSSTPPIRLDSRFWEIVKPLLPNESQKQK
jgi:RNA polymerase sigma factor (sigma-70 family)